MATNPFHLETLPVDAPLCDREQEFDLLLQRGRSKTNVVLFSPRRYGKTSLVQRVQAKLREEDHVTVFCDLYGVISIDEIASRIAKAIFEEIRNNDSLFRKAVSILTSFRPVLTPDPQDGFSVSVQPSRTVSGPELLDQALREMKDFIARSGRHVHVVLDEFQEITEVETGLQIQAIMRTHIQNMDAAFVFVGSRRRILLDMFSNRKKPFFQSAMHMELAPLPDEDVRDYIKERFASTNMDITQQAAGLLINMVHGYPFYLQKLCSLVYEQGLDTIDETAITKGFEHLLASEKYTFELILQSLTTRQTILLRAIAKEPSPSLYATAYMARHGLGSIGGVQGALKILTSLDLVENGPDKTWQPVDPIFGEWLQRLG